MNKLSLVLVTLPCICACTGSKYRVDVGPFFAKGSGRVALQNAGGTLSGQYENDIGRNMGLDDTEASPYLRLQIDRDKHRFRLHGFGTDTDGSGTLLNDYGGIVAGSQVTTSMEFFTIAANWGYQVLRDEHYRLAVGAQAGYYSLDIAARSLAGREQVETDVLVPMPFLEGELLFGTLTIGANAALMSADLGDANGRYLDVEGYVRWAAAPDFDFFSGYRYMVLDAFGRASSRDFDADVDLQGFFFGAGVRF
jgi:hypothetical protein